MKNLYAQFVMFLMGSVIRERLDVMESAMRQMEARAFAAEAAIAGIQTSGSVSRNL